MAKQSVNTLKGWAIRGWKPLAQQIKDWFDSFWHKDELIPIGSIDGLQDILNSLPSQASITSILNTLVPDSITLSADGFYDMPANSILLLVRFESATNQVISIGNAVGTNDFLDAINVVANVPKVEGVLYATGVDVKRFYISGITNEITLKFYKK
jgi:hypothetical protein